MPSLAMSSYKTAPNHQRDLLDIARDLAKLQKAVKNGEKLPGGGSVAFTK